MAEINLSFLKEVGKTLDDLPKEFYETISLISLNTLDADLLEIIDYISNKNEQYTTITHVIN